jgi:hypothetical protein
MKILTIGCSNFVGSNFEAFCRELGGFEVDRDKIIKTPNPSSPNACDVKYVNNRDTWIDLSMKGVGNFYICGRLFEHIEENGKPDYVYLQFTGLTRLDLPLHRKVHVRDYFFQKQTKYKNWVSSGGYTGTWMQNDFLKKQLIYWYDTKDGQNVVDKSLHQIFSALSLLEKLNIPYNWSPYYDYTKPPTSNTDKDGMITAWPDYIDLSKKIPIDPLSVAIEHCDDVPADGVHFGSESFTKFLSIQREHFAIFNL